MASSSAATPWPFASVWQLVKDLAKFNNRDEHQIYPIPFVHSLKPSDMIVEADPDDQSSALEAVGPSEKKPETSELPPPTYHKLLEAYWRCCYRVCEKYILLNDQDRTQADNFFQDLELQIYVNGLCSQLSPDLDLAIRGHPTDNTASLQSLLTIALKTTSVATDMLSNDIDISGSDSTARLLKRLELVQLLWDLRKERRAEYVQQRSRCQGNTASPITSYPPFRACQGDDEWVKNTIISDTTITETYICYYRSYDTQLEKLLSSLNALLFQVIERVKMDAGMIPKPSTVIPGDSSALRKHLDINEFQLCWDICDAIKDLSHRNPMTEGWVQYDLCTSSLNQSTRTWEESTNGVVRTCCSWLWNSWNDVNRHHSHHTVDAPTVGPHPAVLTPTAVPPAKPSTWASLLSAKPKPAPAQTLPVPMGDINLSGSSELSVESSSNMESADILTVFDMEDLEDLHHIRLRILVRAAALKHGGWHTGLCPLADFVRKEMSPTAFGKSEKRRKLFLDYRNAMLNPQNNIKERGDKAAHKATIMQIKRAVEWKTAEGRHIFLRDLFRAVVGVELDEVDDEGSVGSLQIINA